MIHLTQRILSPEKVKIIDTSDSKDSKPLQEVTIDLHVESRARITKQYNKGKSKGNELMPCQKMKNSNSEDSDEEGRRFMVIGLLAAPKHVEMKRIHELRK